MNEQGNLIEMGMVQKKPRQQSGSGVLPKFSLEVLQTSFYYNL
jgi:hypothetical protein